MKKILLILLIAFGICTGSVFADENSDWFNNAPDKEMTNIPKIFVSDDILHIQNVEEGTKVEIYSIVGTKVKTIMLSNGIIDVSDLNKGIYIVKVAKTSQKIVIQ